MSFVHSKTIQLFLQQGNQRISMNIDKNVQGISEKFFGIEIPETDSNQTVAVLRSSTLGKILSPVKLKHHVPLMPLLNFQTRTLCFCQSKKFQRFSAVVLQTFPHNCFSIG